MKEAVVTIKHPYQWMAQYLSMSLSHAEALLAELKAEIAKAKVEP